MDVTKPYEFIGSFNQLGPEKLSTSTGPGKERAGRARHLVRKLIRGIPKWFSAKHFLEARGAEANENTHLQENDGSSALQPKATRPKKHDVPENVWFVGLGTPGIQKTLGQKTTSGTLPKVRRTTAGPKSAMFADKFGLGTVPTAISVVAASFDH